MNVPDGARKFAAVLAVSACAAHVAAPAAYGCAFHNTLPEAQLDGMHPGSLSVAVALRKAADSGVIDAAALEAPHTHAALYVDTVARLQAFRSALAASELPAGFSLGYVESGLWSRYARAGRDIALEVHTDGPADGEAVLLTGEPVLRALLAGTLSVDRAEAEGLVVIDADESDAAAIRQALMVTSGYDRIGSR